MTASDTKNDMAHMVEQMRETDREKLESMEAEGVTCIPIEESL